MKKIKVKIEYNVILEHYINVELVTELDYQKLKENKRLKVTRI